MPCCLKKGHEGGDICKMETNMGLVFEIGGLNLSMNYGLATQKSGYQPSENFHTTMLVNTTFLHKAGQYNIFEYEKFQGSFISSTSFRPALLLYRKQFIGFQWKLMSWFLYSGNTGLKIMNHVETFP